MYLTRHWIGWSLLVKELQKRKKLRTCNYNFYVYARRFSVRVEDPLRTTRMSMNQFLHHGLLALQWRHNESDGVSNHRCDDCLLYRVFRKHQSSASLASVRGIHRSSVNSPHKGPVTRKMFPSDDVIMCRGVPSLNMYESFSRQFSLWYGNAEGPLKIR